MEASRKPEPDPEAIREPSPGHVFLDPEIVEIHIQNNEPIDGAKARMIYRMNNPIWEFDPEHGPGIARPGEW